MADFGVGFVARFFLRVLCVVNVQRGRKAEERLREEAEEKLKLAQWASLKSYGPIINTVMVGTYGLA